MGKALSALNWPVLILYIYLNDLQCAKLRYKNYTFASLIAAMTIYTKPPIKSEKGDAENPGNNVKAKSGLNKSILDQGWFEFRRQLEYVECGYTSNADVVGAINILERRHSLLACGESSEAA